MYHFLETIKIVDGEIQHLDLHLQRIQNTCVEYYGHEKNLDDMRSSFKINSHKKKDVYKLSIWYNLTQHFFQTEKYLIKKKEKIVWCFENEINYQLKYLDRNIFEKYEKKHGAESMCIIVKNNKPTDATYANLAFWTGKEWHTPMFPLLKGTKRKYLIEQKKLIEKDIDMKDLAQYEKVSFINAMLDLRDVEIIL